MTPGVPKPARELYGTMLLEHGMAKEALAAFEATIAKEPNRLGAYVGAARSAEKANDAAKTKQYYAKVVALANNADATRTEVADARAFVAKRIHGCASFPTGCICCSSCACWATCLIAGTILA